jgi:apolipoprotein N-acyltransferase
MATALHKGTARSMGLAPRYLLAAASGLLLALPFTDVLLFPAWFALAPVFHLVAEAPTRRRALGLAAAFVAPWVFVSLFFLSRTTWCGMTAASLYTGAWYVCALLGVRVLARRGTWSAVFGTAALWALVEIGRARIPVFGFPWLLLGHATVECPNLRQAADLLGAYGLSFLVAAVNAALAFLGPALASSRAEAPPGTPLRRRGALGAVLALLLAALVYGRWRVGEIEGRLAPGPRIALIQGCTYRKVDRTDDEKSEQLEAHLKLHTQAARPDAEGFRPDLIGWAETAVPGTFNTGEWAERFRRHVRATGIPTLCGADWIDPADLGSPLEEQRWYNAAFVLDGRGEELAHYAKRRLVPFGEYIPFKELFPSLQALQTVTRDTYAAGRSPSPVCRVAGVDFAFCICIEDAHPDLAREAAGTGAQAFLNVTNDAWFKGTHAAVTHLRAAALRAVETRRPLVRATNSGVSCHVDPLGRIRVVVPPDEVGVGRFQLTLVDGGAPATLALRLGEGGAGVLFLGVLILALVGDRARNAS